MTPPINCNNTLKNLKHDIGLHLTYFLNTYLFSPLNKDYTFVIAIAMLREIEFLLKPLKA